MRTISMMMEETDADNGSISGMEDQNLDDDSTNPPSFALKPDMSDEDDGINNGESRSTSRSVTPPPSDTAPGVASEPLDLLSATAEPAPSQATSNGGFDGFAMTEGEGNSATTQEEKNSVTSSDANPRELQTAESGDLLHLTDEPYKAQNEEPADFMDNSFQTMPFTAATTATEDPFENTASTGDLMQGSCNGDSGSPQNGMDDSSNNSAQANSEGEASATPQQKGNNSEKEAASITEAGSEIMNDESNMEDVELTSPVQDSVAAEGNRREFVTKSASNEAKEKLKPPLSDHHSSTDTAKDTSLSLAPNQEQERRIKELEAQLSKAQETIVSMKEQKENDGRQQKEKEAENTTILQELQDKLQQQQTQRAEAENQLKLAKEENKKLIDSMQEQQEQWHVAIEESRVQLHAVEQENERLVAKAKEEREERKEHERRERVLANKLNNLKKQQATKTDVEDVYEDDMRLLKEEVATKTKKIKDLELAHANLQDELEQHKVTAQARIESLEKAIREEKHLNEERKKKMKAFVEAKSEELKEAQAQAEQYQNELNQNNQGMVDLNQRWKTLHAQWVQSQTRNRELQRDLNKIKKDYENLNKVGDTVNAKLSRSSNEVEQHKNKRLAAKQELMSVLGKLDAEREISSKLRDSVRFTFTPKAQSQHQLLKENLDEFQKQLEALARRLGKPIPLSNSQDSQTLASMVMSSVEESEASEREDDLTPSKDVGANGGQNNISGDSREQRKVLMETTRLLAKLEVETQSISQGIMALTSGIEQMHQLIAGGGERTCFTSLGDIFLGGGVRKALESGQGRPGNDSPRGRGAVKSGHVSHFPTERIEAGQMT